VAHETLDDGTTQPLVVFAPNMQDIQASLIGREFLEKEAAFVRAMEARRSQAKPHPFLR
jgi:hypothetical protein